MDTTVIEDCTFCQIVQRRLYASVVLEDALVLAFLDLHQFIPGHTLVIPKTHVPDLRTLDEQTGVSLMAALVKVTKAVDATFTNEGISVWNSIGPAAFQEVPHLHFHIQPRRTGDAMLRVYPSRPPALDQETLDSYAARIREGFNRETH